MKTMNDTFRSAMVMDSMASLNVLFAMGFCVILAFSFLARKDLPPLWWLMSIVFSFVFLCAFFLFEDRSSKYKVSLKNQSKFSHIIVTKKYRNWFLSINLLMAIGGLSLGVFLRLLLQEELSELQRLSVLITPFGISLLAIALLLSIVEVRDEKIIIPKPFLFSAILLSAITVLVAITWGHLNTDTARLVTLAAPMFFMDLIIFLSSTERKQV